MCATRPRIPSEEIGCASESTKWNSPGTAKCVAPSCARALDVHLPQFFQIFDLTFYVHRITMLPVPSNGWTEMVQVQLILTNWLLPRAVSFDERILVP